MKALPDPGPLWDFDDPAASEGRFRAALAGAGDPAEAGLWSTQLARALGLQGRYDEGRALLDGLAAHPEVAVRATLEAGLLSRSSGDERRARGEFDRAVALAAAAGLDQLHVDALHMVALVAPVSEQVAVAEAALAIAVASADPRARDWEASLLNNIGMAHSDAGDLSRALEAFEAAQRARVRMGDPARLRIARWMVAWTLRRLGRGDEALAIQRALKDELDELGEVDPYVDEELTLLDGGD